MYDTLDPVLFGLPDSGPANDEPEPIDEAITWHADRAKPSKARLARLARRNIRALGDRPTRSTNA